jgi:superoxide dismutase, Fe-Mn family
MKAMNKRTFLKNAAFLGAGSFLGGKILASPGSFRDIPSPAGESLQDAFTLPPLPYAYEALEPFIDVQTMQVHHDKHHAAYTKNLNAAVVAENLQGKSIEEILGNVSKYSTAVKNNGGGYYNHNFFWGSLSPKGGDPSAALTEALNRDFGSVQAFKDEFSKKAISVFGSGWAWLIWADGKLKVISTANQDCPLMDIAADKGAPILNLDVWEHAYYLKYQNKRKDYVDAFWNIVNWEGASGLFARAVI